MGGSRRFGGFRARVSGRAESLDTFVNIIFPHRRNDSQAGILKHAPYLIGDPFPVTICPQPELRLMSIEKEILEIGEQVTEKEEQCFDIGNRGISKKRLHGFK